MLRTGLVVGLAIFGLAGQVGAVPPSGSTPPSVPVGTAGAMNRSVAEIHQPASAVVVALGDATVPTTGRARTEPRGMAPGASYRVSGDGTTVSLDDPGDGDPRPSVLVMVLAALGMMGFIAARRA